MLDSCLQDNQILMMHWNIRVCFMESFLQIPDPIFFSTHPSPATMSVYSIVRIGASLTDSEATWFSPDVTSQVWVSQKRSSEQNIKMANCFWRYWMIPVFAVQISHNNHSKLQKLWQRRKPSRWAFGIHLLVVSNLQEGTTRVWHKQELSQRDTGEASKPWNDEINWKGSFLIIARWCTQKITKQNVLNLLSLGTNTKGEPKRDEYPKCDAIFAGLRFFCWITWGRQINRFPASGVMVKASGAFPCWTSGGREQEWPPMVKSTQPFDSMCWSTLLRVCNGRSAPFSYDGFKATDHIFTSSG